MGHKIRIEIELTDSDLENYLNGMDAPRAAFDIVNREWCSQVTKAEWVEEQNAAPKKEEE